MAAKDEVMTNVFTDFEAIEPLERDGVFYPVGAKVPLTDIDAIALIANGIVK